MSKKQLQVLIVDDEIDRSRNWAESINSFDFDLYKINAVALTKEETNIATIATIDRLKRALAQKAPLSSDIQCQLDSVDILIVDYDLQELLGDGLWSTGLQVTPLARAFSTAKAIVLVNQFGTNTFDLTLSKGAKSYSAYDVGSDQILNPAFWDRSRLNGYAPWAWNDGILRAPHRIEETIQWVQKNLDEPVLSSLGFSTNPDESSSYISKELWQSYLITQDCSFRQLVTTSELLTKNVRESISKFDSSCARVAAAMLMHWLERWVIPANEVLIDLPHLASYHPWLLINAEIADNWQRCTSLDCGFDALQPSVRKYEFSPGFPISRPTVWRQRIADDQSLAEPSGFTYEKLPDFAFCEDTSQFHEFKDTRPFLSSLPGRDSERFVADATKVRFAKSNYSLEGIMYEPSVLFSL